MINKEFAHLAKGLDLSLFESYVRIAVRAGSSDIHFEPLPTDLRVRIRVEGELHELARLPHPAPGKKPHPVVVQIKAKSNMSLQSRLPEDGRCEVTADDVNLSLRVASMPQVHGEKIVMRIFDVSRIYDLGELGYREHNLARLKEIVGRQQGIVFLAGPTGCGKTTTLYACLNYLNSPNRNIITVEDPVEHYFFGINQVQVEPGGVTFSTAMRSLLRHDPDIIMIGEVRDPDTAEMAFHAALTGHLVLSTVHANDAVGVITRLLDLEVPPVILSQAINGIIAQRLLRQICPRCAVKAIHPPLEMIPTYEIRGCPACHHTGYAGRQGIQEVLIMSDNLRKMISRAFNPEEFRLLALKEGMQTLKEDAIQKSIMGQVNYRDALGVTDEPISRIRRDIERALETVKPRPAEEATA